MQDCIRKKRVFPRYMTENLEIALEGKRADRLSRIRQVTIDGAKCAQIPLTQGMCAIVDDSDVPLVSQFCWCVTRATTGIRYAHANVGRTGKKIEYLDMHRFLAGPHEGLDVDHRNGNGLDNRRCNLRICTHQQNMRNAKRHHDGTSRYKGVSWYRQGNKWRAQLVVDNRQLHLGYFYDETEAALAYDVEAKSRFGEFARLNFPEPSAKHWSIPMIGL